MIVRLIGAAAARAGEGTEFDKVIQSPIGERGSRVGAVGDSVGYRAAPDLRRRQRRILWRLGRRQVEL